MRPACSIVLAVVLLAGCGGGDRLSGGDLPQGPAHLRVSSPAFVDGSRLAPRYTCDGPGQEPPVTVGTTPARTRELAVVVSDPDAPRGTFVHLTRYGIPPRGDGALDGGRVGRNSAGGTGWTPPCPPPGDDPHRYVWSVYALADPSGLDAGAEPGRVADALKHDVLASGTITARYGR
ncbi:MAG TPA: YbhB/YbcL family Raf kinase inhibitor-like protein [Baekduia sp.]|nr:YbhB/YbcL family Raf kinase inhibitor-like protein [Baekduia sp.]